MANPYFLMAILYVSLAVLTALDASLTSLNLLPWFNGLRWLRVHLITLGALTEVFFGLLPGLVAVRVGQPRPRTRWDIWFSLNAGLLILLIGIPLINATLILAGGTLVFIAASLLWLQLTRLPSKTPLRGSSSGRKFYLAGLGYLLVGIIVGTGLWLGWGQVLHISVPIEVHIHANSFGFMALVFAGLLVDLYPDFARRPLAWPRSITPIFWMMTLGALGLVLYPWLHSLWFAIPGLILHLGATIWLLLNVVKPLWGDRRAWTPGMWHLVTAYVWVLVPILVTPLIIFEILPGQLQIAVDQNAPQALIYGWVLQFGYALLPYLFAKVLLPGQTTKLGGNWFSLITVHLGGIFIWISIFSQTYQATQHGIGYAFWVVSALPILLELWRIVRTGLARVERDEVALLSEPVAVGDRT